MIHARRVYKFLGLIVIGAAFIGTAANASNVIHANMSLMPYFNSHFGMTSEHPGGLPENVAIPILEVFDSDGNAMLFVAGQKQVTAALHSLPQSLSGLHTISGFQKMPRILALMKTRDGNALDTRKLNKHLPTVIYIAASNCPYCGPVHKDLLALLHTRPQFPANVLDVSLECLQCTKQK